ncbi:MAG TPA: tetratricopeptide repeat protein [Steroidobacteraceae bacterium]|jgi:hypothetical protein
MQDYLGNPVSGSEAGTIAAIDDFIEGFLAYETRAEHILKAADSDPNSCLANAYAGLLWMLLEAPEAPQRASRYLLAAERASGAATRREQLIVAVLKSWIGDDLARALKVCDQISDEFPRDLAAVKLHQYFEFNRGNAPEMLRVALKVLPAAADVPYVHGMAAFGFEQCHLLADAESAARRALAMRSKEPWAQHALAHVMLTRGRIDEGAQFLEEVSGTWQDLNSFMVTHIYWHLALFYLSQGRHRAALAIYDEHCWGVAKQYSQDQIGAVSLLARFELAGIDVADRWQDVADHLAPRAGDMVQPFLTMQYLFGLARAGRAEADSLLRHVREHLQRTPPMVRGVWQEVALPACEGLHAYASGDFERAYRKLELALPRMLEVGGSHAQRDLFEQLLLNAARRSGRLVPAQQLLELRRQNDPDGVPLNLALADVYSQLNLPALAQAARGRAERTRLRHAS